MDNTIDIKAADEYAGSSAVEERQKKAKLMAQKIAMSIGGDSDNSDKPVSEAAYSEEPTRERTAPSRPIRPAAAQRSPQGQRNRSSSGTNGRAARSGSERYSSQRGRSGGKNGKRRKKKSSSAGAIIGFLLGFIVVLIGVGYFIGLMLTNGKFLPHTSINGTDVSRMTLAEATEALKPEEETGLVVYKADGSTVIIPAKDFDYGDDTEQQIQKIYSGINRKLWFKSLFTEFNYKFESKKTYDEDKLSQELDNVVWGVTESRNAYITHTDEGFVIVDAVQGDKVDYSVLKPYILQQVRKGNFTVKITDCDCLEKAEIQAEDLQDKLDLYNQLGDFTISIDFDYTQEQITLDDYSSWVRFSEDGTSYTIDRNEVAQFVGYLADTYDTYGTPRLIHTTLQGDKYVQQGKQGTYGWMIDQEATTDLLMRLIDEGQTVTTDPIYATRLDNDGIAFFTYAGIESARSAESDIGNTYIEVDLTAQHIWFYNNGQLAFETDQVVSGLPTDESRITPEGIYEVLDKESPALMSGDGYTNVRAEYFIRVSYEGIGFHDLSRRAYGGEIYKTDGSHGCLNMKLAEVKELYNMVPGGTPVIMYY